MFDSFPDPTLSHSFPGAPGGPQGSCKDPARRLQGSRKDLQEKVKSQQILVRSLRDPCGILAGSLAGVFFPLAFFWALKFSRAIPYPIPTRSVWRSRGRGVRERMFNIFVPHHASAKWVLVFISAACRLTPHTSHLPPSCLLLPQLSICQPLCPPLSPPLASLSPY